MPLTPNSSFGLAVLGDDCTAKLFLLAYLFIDMVVANKFLMDTGFIRRQMRCNTFGLDITCCVRPQSKGDFLGV